jgi:hypothetical protein
VPGDSTPQKVERIYYAGATQGAGAGAEQDGMELPTEIERIKYD